ncbi:MAG: GNAT family N-acetyltransferase [Bacilli bacterium]|nr:GNAT family N-acetyltransferase [Bacilli bacterium]
MESLYLKKLDEKDKDLWLEYWKDFYKTGNMSEENWNKFQNISWPGKLYYIKTEEKSISQLNIYYLIENDKMIGRIYIHLKPELLPKDKHDGSHISYQIIPSKRNQGYGSKILHLGIEKCHEAGLEEVIVSCNEKNIGSSKIIEKNGGILVSIEPDNFEKGEMLKTYKIEIETSLNKYDSRNSA